MAIAHYWRKLPVLVKAIFSGIAILLIGQMPQSLIIFTNLQIAPEIPIFLPLILLWLFIFLKYLNGSWKPESTATIRNQYLCAHKVSPKIWFWSLVAGGIGLIGVLGLIFVLSKHTELPPAAYNAPFDLAPFPWWTKLSIFLSIAATAGVVEEAAPVKIRMTLDVNASASYEGGLWGLFRQRLVLTIGAPLIAVDRPLCWTQ